MDRYTTIGLPEDTGEGYKSPIAQLICELEDDPTLMLKERSDYAIRIAKELNIKVSDFSERARVAEAKWYKLVSMIVAEDEVSILKLKDTIRRI